MATENTRERDPLTPLRDGEFWRIPGIGPGIAQRLQTAGIQTFRQLASLAPEEICAQLTGIVGMTAQRIANQDWPGKAEHLAQQIAEADLPHELQDPGKQQHYASFMVELLQDENHTVRRTRVVHIQNGEKDSWAGWDIGRLDHWIADQASIAPAANNLPSESKEKSLAQMMAVELGGSSIFLPSGEETSRFLIEGQSFMIHLPLTIKTTDLPSVPLRCRASIQVRPIAEKRSQMMEIDSAFDPHGDRVLSIPVEALGEGAYRLDASVLVYPEGSSQPEKDGCSAFSEGELIYVFSREAETSA